MRLPRPSSSGTGFRQPDCLGIPENPTDFRPIVAVQEETTVLGVPCLTLRQNTERPATVEQGTNHIVGVDPDHIFAAAQAILERPQRPRQCPPLWDGKAASRIVKILHEHLHGEGQVRTAS